MTEIMNVGEKYLPRGDGVEKIIDSGFTFFFFAKCISVIAFTLLLAGYLGSSQTFKRNYVVLFVK